MLGEAHAELAERFAMLAASRRTRGAPVYALEHGFDIERMAALKTAASNKLRQQGLHNADWLVWIALAAEAGYAYAGEEYWPELAHTPGGWRSNDDRNTLRQWFRRFQTNYGGPTPVGRWADHFSIISWPIANAILPRYLQNLFARHLYNLRFDLAHRAGLGLDGLGRFLDASYEGGSSRFSDFLQQTDLTGRIVLALRDDDQADTAARIDPTLLSRIVADLGRRRDSREYLRETQDVMRAARIRFAGRLAGGGQAVAIRENGVGANVQAIRLAARRHSDGRVVLGVILPDVASAFKRAGRTPSEFGHARMRVCGADERWSPAEALLTLSRCDRALTTFPQPLESVVVIEGASAGLADLVTPLCRIVERPCWILRRYADGLYREVLSAHVRAGQSYLILSRAALPEADCAQTGLSRCEVAVADIHAYALELPNQISSDARTALARLHIGTRVGVTIEPAGLNPRGSAGDRSLTWLSTEMVSLRIASDFSVRRYQVRLDDGPPQGFASSGSELFLSLGLMDIGDHTLEVSVPPSDLGGGPDALGARAATLSFSIAAPQPWPEAVRTRAGFRLIGTPGNGSLEEFLSGRAVMQLLGPAGRQASWSIETFDAAGHLASTGVGGATPVSAAPAAIAAVLDKLRQAHSDAIDVAHRVDIVAAIDELGRQALRFPHVVEPLRWIFEPPHDVARLVDETAHEAPVAVRAYDLATPLRPRKIATANAIAGIPVEAPGVLFVATYQGRSYKLFASRPSADRFTSLAQLGFEQNLAQSVDAAAALLIVARAMRRWHFARAVGHLGILRKSITLDRMNDAIAAIACGADFVQLLKGNSSKALARAQVQVGGSPGFGARMRSFSWSLRAAEVVEPFARFAANYRIESDKQRCRDAVRIAFAPLALRFGSSEADRARLAELLANQTLMRGAHLARATAGLAARTVPKSMAS